MWQGLGSLPRGLRYTLLYCYFRYVYKPRLAAGADRIRLLRVLLLLLLTGSALAYYQAQQQSLQLPFLPLAEKDSVGATAPQQLSQQLSRPDKPVPVPQQHFRVSVLNAQSLRAYELEQRLETNWKKIDLMLDNLGTNTQHQEASSSGSVMAASSHSEQPDYAAYELMVESHLQQAGEALYHERYGAQGLNGAALISLTLTPTGKLREVKILQRSGNRIIDRLLLEAVSRAAPYAPFLPSMQTSSITMERWLRLTPDSGFR